MVYSVSQDKNETVRSSMQDDLQPKTEGPLLEYDAASNDITAVQQRLQVY